MQATYIQKRLTWLWTHGHSENIQANSEKICTIEISHRRDMLGLHLDKPYGQIQFDRWFDDKIFHKIFKGRYTPNDIGVEVNIQHSSGGGSAWLEFDADKLELVKETLIKCGYQIDIIEE